MRHDIEAIKMLNKAKGQFFFSPGTMRFFNSKISSNVINDRFFITSERFDDEHPRLFTIRVIDWHTGEIGTHGEFQEYKTAEQAKRVAETLH